MPATTFSAEEAGLPYVPGQVTAGMSPEIVRPDQKLFTKELVEWVKTPKPGDYILDRRFLPGLSELAETAHFVEISDHGKTRENSGHETRFGQLVLHSADDAEQTLYVAVKPFHRPLRAAHEYAVTSYIASNNIADLTTFRPIGIYRLPEDKQEFGLITNYRHTIRSTDTVLWNPDLIDDPQVVAKALGRGASSLAALHANGWTHGDAQAKNIAWDILEPNDRTFLVDVEDAKPFPRAYGKVDTEAAAEAVREDLKAFISSAFYLEDVPENHAKMVEDAFVKVYAGKVGVRGNSPSVPYGVLPTQDQVLAVLQHELALY